MRHEQIWGSKSINIKIKLMCQKSRKKANHLGQTVLTNACSFQVVNEFSNLGFPLSTNNDEMKEVQRRLVTGNHIGCHEENIAINRSSLPICELIVTSPTCCHNHVCRSIRQQKYSFSLSVCKLILVDKIRKFLKSEFPYYTDALLKNSIPFPH